MLLRYERKKDFLEGEEWGCGTGKGGLWDVGGVNGSKKGGCQGKVVGTNAEEGLMLGGYGHTVVVGGKLERG